MARAKLHLCAAIKVSLILVQGLRGELTGSRRTTALRLILSIRPSDPKTDRSGSPVFHDARLEEVRQLVAQPTGSDTQSKGP
jgi:hypothetical protein